MKMKNLKHLAMLLVGFMVTVICFSSCISDGDDYSIDEATQKSYMKTMTGMYNGKVRMHYVSNSPMNYQGIVKYDSINTTWTVRQDSTLTLYDFPVNKLDSAIYISKNASNAETQDLRALQEAISNIKTPANIQCYYYVPTSTFVNSQIIQYFVNPVYFKQTLTYNGKTHDVYFVFRTNYYGGAFTISSRQFDFNMFLQSISIDKVPVDYSNSVPSTYFRGLLITCNNK